MVYEFVWDLKGRHWVLSCGELMEVMVGYTGFRLTIGGKSRFKEANLAKFGWVKLNFSSFRSNFGGFWEWFGHYFGT